MDSDSRVHALGHYIYRNPNSPIKTDSRKLQVRVFVVVCLFVFVFVFLLYMCDALSANYKKNN